MEKGFFHFLNLLPTQGTVLDIGANIGIMTYHLSKKMTQGEVLAFEPIPTNYKVLQKIVSRYNLNNVQLFTWALGLKNEKVKMVLPVVQSVKMQGLSHVIHESINEFNDGEIVEVAAKKLDDIIKKPVCGIKIDVENFEYFVLQGGVETLKKYLPVIYIELWDNQNRYNCFDLFKKLNYKILVCNNDKLVEFDAQLHQEQNFIIVPK